MSKGHVYILSNPAMPDMLKIGKTTRTVEQRCAELYQTGVPVEFKVEASVLVPDCHEAERYMHQTFADNRVSVSREFFNVPLDKAKSALMDCKDDQLLSFLSEFDDNKTIVSDDMHISESDIALIAHRVGVSAEDIASCFYLIEPDEIRPALTRLYTRRQNRKGLPFAVVGDGAA